jgi:hypothetical protein
MEREEYLEERKILVELESRAYSTYDRTIITLASGAIAVSITFSSSILRGDSTLSWTVYLLFASWLFWLLSILSQLMSFLITAKVMRNAVERLNSEYLEYEEGRPINEMIASVLGTKETQKPIDPKGFDKYAGWPTFLNKYSLGTFTAGVIIFLIFAYNQINMPQNSEKVGTKGSEAPVRVIAAPQKPQEKK